MSEEEDFVWMADFGSDRWHSHPPKIGKVKVVKRMNKTLVVEYNQFSGYRTRVPIKEAFSTREELIDAISLKCHSLADELEERARDFRKAVKK